MPNFNGAGVEVWKWISNLITYYPKHVSTYQCWHNNKQIEKQFENSELCQLLPRFIQVRLNAKNLLWFGIGFKVQAKANA